MDFYEFALRFVSEHPFITFVLICSVYYCFQAPWEIWKRNIRSRDIQKHGWPIAPMDSDGDIRTTSGDSE